MDNRKLIAYAVDADSGEITWHLYDEPWKTATDAHERHYVGTAMNLEA